MKTILENFFFQIEIEKSKFLGYAIAINNEEDAKNEAKSEYWDIDYFIEVYKM